MISSLGYLRIESADVAAWREFGLKVLGMTEGSAPKSGGPEDGAVYLRMDDFPARLVILPGSSERLLVSGWEVADAAALAAVGRALADAGVAYKTGTPDGCAARRVGSMLRADDPAGHPGRAPNQALAWSVWLGSGGSVNVAPGGQHAPRAVVRDELHRLPADPRGSP